MAKAADDLKARERQLVRTGVEHFVKEFCSKLTHPKNVGQLFPYQELTAQLLERFDVDFKKKEKADDAASGD